MVMLNSGRKYVVYDDNGFILIITRYKNIARNVMKVVSNGTK